MSEDRRVRLQQTRTFDLFLQLKSDLMLNSARWRASGSLYYLGKQFESSPPYQCGAQISRCEP